MNNSAQSHKLMQYSPQWAINATTELAQNQWKHSRFHDFMQKATVSEFLASQEPFYFAVKAFPQMLALLASLIEDSATRLVVIENLYEEHGKGNPAGFHTHSYLKYLQALGMNENTVNEVINGNNIHNPGLIKENPWVSQWIEKILKKQDNPLRLAAYLAGIECLYAVISQDICSWLKDHHLIDKQTHYTYHAKLDWEHGTELFDLALQMKYQYGLQNPVLYKEHIMHAQITESFTQAQKDFLELYEHMVVPTHAQMLAIHQQPVSFYYIREDSAIEQKALNTLVTNRKCNAYRNGNSTEQSPVSILSIASGGEHLMHYLAQDYPVKIAALDMNAQQLDLAQKKIQALLEWYSPQSYKGNDVNDNNHGYDYLPTVFKEHNTGKFEQIFALLRQSLQENGVMPEKISDEKLSYVVSLLFTNENLNTVFGADATRLTTESFAQHFTEVFIQALTDKETNSGNIFYQKPLCDYAQLAHAMQHQRKNHALTWEVVNMKDDYYLNRHSTAMQDNYDLMDLSNIGDWMSLKQYHQMIHILMGRLNHGGIVIARKLLGDYSLANTLKEHGLNVQQALDSTGFYRETVYGFKS